MKKGGGKAKGAGFERLICKRLSQWLSGGLREDLFWRSAMSGGRATVMHKSGKKNKTQGGDITATDPIGHKLIDIFSVECKCVRNLALDSAMVKGKGEFITFWEQTCYDALRANKVPLLIAHQNQMPTIVATMDVRGVDFKATPLGVIYRRRSAAILIYDFEALMASPCPLL